MSEDKVAIDPSVRSAIAEMFRRAMLHCESLSMSLGCFMKVDGLSHVNESVYVLTNDAEDLVKRATNEYQSFKSQLDKILPNYITSITKGDNS